MYKRQGNEYTLEIYYKNNDVTNPEHVKGSSSAESYSYVTDYIEKSLGADVVWGPITPFGQEGVYKKDGTSYKVNITFGMDKHPIKVFDYQTPIQYYKMTSEGRGDKYISQFTYSVTVSYTHLSVKQ